MREKNEITEANVYISKIYAITKPEQANKIIEKAKEESKTSGIPYKDVLSNEFMKLLDGSEIENKTNIMEINFNGKIEDISMMLLSAERYALGRQTYIVQWTCEVIGGNTHLLTTKDLKVMIRDIENAESYGADFDKKEWFELLDILKLILSKRRKEKMDKMIEQEYDLKLEKGKAVCFDFDGVIHKYRKGWQDGSIYDEPNTEMLDLILLLQNLEIPVFICSTRNPIQIIEWWDKNILNPKRTLIGDGVKFWNDTKYVGITNKKLPAQLYIDDRAYKYTGQTVKQFIIDNSILIKEEKNDRKS